MGNQNLRVALGNTRTFYKATLLSVLLLLSSNQALAGQLCLDPVGDIDGSGVTNVVDVQCELLTILWTLSGENGTAPSCLAGTVPTSDVSCDDVTSVVDGVLLIKIALGTSIESLDGNGNGCPDSCEPAICGDGTCEEGEDCASCAQDCGACCGNNVCDNGETCETCVGDCGECPAVCGDGTCEGDKGEDCSSCESDCGACPAVCGDGVCEEDKDEDCSSCESDCGACCGDGVCAGPETCGNCPGDCGVCCGNGICDPFEDCSSCETDCGSCCGDGICDPTIESCSTCEADCGACCGDGICDESIEDCTSCETDCGACPTFCGDGACDNNEDCDSCPLDCTSGCGPTCGDFFCDPPEDCESCPNDCQCPEVCGNEFCGDGEDCTNCSDDCGECPPVCGDFACTGDETCETCPEDCTEGCVEAFCGDQTCDDNENCSTCVDDCGECPVVCGDALCEENKGETCATCEADCGSCCGNDLCDQDETCETCPQDCGGPCCGNGICNATEDCSTCEIDCGTCPSVCGDEVCEEEKGETCETCSDDCGECPPVAGDGVCESQKGEHCLNSPEDCPDCICGDGECHEPLEGCSDCPDDCGVCPAPENDCCEAVETPGCEDQDISGCVCLLDTTCCEVAWTEECVDLARDECNKDCPVSGTTDCCISHVTPGCGDAGAGGTTHNVVIANQAFVPENITVTQGDTVVWTNNDAFHTVVSTSEGESFNSGFIFGGETFSHTFTIAGNHSYESTIGAKPSGFVTVTPACEACVCDLDPTCCSDLWDAGCVGLASSACHGGCGCGDAPSQDCCEPGADVGCASAECSTCVCSEDLLCCSVAWDEDCALAAHVACAGSCTACPDPSDCCSPHFPSSCGNVACSDCVCETNSLCCEASWDESCVTDALTCQAECGCAQEDGCAITQGAAGTTNPACDACVCELEPDCCNDNWTEACLNFSQTSCNYACGCGPLGLTEECGDVWSCALDCAAGDADCLEVCEDSGTLEAQALYGDIFQCATYHDCLSLETPFEVNQCAQQKCSLKYGTCHAPEPGADCCNPHDSGGCPVPPCENCVCALDASCCDIGWDEECVALSQDACFDPCVCVPDTPLPTCGQVYNCVSNCPTDDDGSCQDVCTGNAVGDAGALFAPFASCAGDANCNDYEEEEVFLLCLEGLCTSSYSQCIGHQVAPDCCGPNSCTQNNTCLGCVANVSPGCAANWSSGCGAIADNQCEAACGCDPADAVEDCGAYDACVSACGVGNMPCIGDCIAVSDPLELLDHGALSACYLENECYGFETTAEYNACYQGFCGAEMQACFSP